MGEKYLIDTSAIIKYLKERLPPKGISFMDGVIDTESVISFVSEIELQVWNPTDLNEMAVYRLFVDNSTIIDIDPSIKQETIRIRKQHKLKLPDAFIAATAMVYDLTLIADNDADFKKVAGLKYVNPSILR